MLNSVSAMVFHFGCELHEQHSFFHMLANECREGMNEDGVKAETIRKKKERKTERPTDRQAGRQAGRQTDEWMSWGRRDGKGIRWTEQKEGGRRGGKEGGRGSTVHAPLPMQRGLLPGGTQTLSPCPALYSPGYCSQINLACYPV